MHPPTTYRQAVMQAVHCLNTVTVPMGNQMGTDSSPSSGEGLGDHTMWGVIYDHKQGILYLRSEENQSLQRVVLDNIRFEKGAKPWSMPISTGRVPWFVDAGPGKE
jgi:penicillin V acylase-like amidase (Ntn superfamily)